MLALVGYYEPWWIQILKALIIFFVFLNLLPICIVGERKLLGRFQHRYGPNRVGPFGFGQPIAEILKFATKEPMQPKTASGFLFGFLLGAAGASRQCLARGAVVSDADFDGEALAVVGAAFSLDNVERLAALLGHAPG